MSIGLALAIILRSRTISSNSLSLNLANSGPVIICLSLSVFDQSPICLPISIAVPVVSPVTILTLIPAFIHSVTAAGTSVLIGSEIATIPKKLRPVATTFPLSIYLSLSSSI